MTLKLEANKREQTGKQLYSLARRADSGGVIRPWFAEC